MITSKVVDMLDNIFIDIYIYMKDVSYSFMNIYLSIGILLVKTLLHH